MGRLDSLSPLAVLARGYALARRERDGAILRRASDVGPGDRLRIRLAPGVKLIDVLGPDGNIAPLAADLTAMEANHGCRFGESKAIF